MPNPPYKPSRGPDDADLFIVGDSPTQKDIAQGLPFSGQGAIYFSTILAQAGHRLSDCYCTTALNYWPPRGKADSIFHNKTAMKSDPSIRLLHGEYIKEDVLRQGKRLWDDIDRVRPKFILALGGVALWFLTGERSISKWRGSKLTIKRPWGEICLLPSYHPSAVMRKQEWKAVLRHDLTAIDLTGDTWTPPHYDLTVHHELPPLLAYLEDLLRDLHHTPKHLAVDIETRAGYITVLGWATSPTEAMVIPFTHFAHGNCFSAHDEHSFMRLVKQILEHPNAIISGQGFHYDYQYLAKLYGIRPNYQYDSMQMQHVFTTKNLPLSLDFLASLHCRHYVYWKDDGKDFHNTIKTEADQTLYWEYNGFDCCRTWEVVENLRPQIEAEDSWAKDVYSFQRSMMLPALGPMLRGVRFDTRKQGKFLSEMRVLKAHYESWFARMIPEEWAPRKTKKEAPWWDSAHKQKKLFYGEFGMTPILKRQPSGKKTPTTDDAALGVLAKREPLLAPIFHKLQEYRSINLFISLYLTSPPSPEDSRMRTSYDLAGTSTFRLASRKDAFGLGLNLQNITSGK